MGASLASGQAVINWDHLTDGPFSSGGNLNASNFTTTGTDTVMTFSDSSPAFQNGANNYTGIDNYAGINVTTDATIDGGDFFRLLYRPNNGFRYQYADTDGTNTPTSVELSYVSMFLKQDFDNGLDAATVDFSGGGTMKVTVGDGGFGETDLRFVVRNNTDYYISETSFDETAIDAIDPGEDVIAVELADVNNSNWAIWDPTNARFDAGAATFSAESFTDVTGVGYYGLRQDNTSPVGDIVGFTAAVPEPSTLGLALGLLAFTGVICRRFRK